jgi:prepilin-type N-terminal cleavage/methylation domain-containing protein
MRGTLRSTRRPAASRMGGTRGFTLMELMLVIVTMGIILAAALPRINLEGYKVSAAVRGITASLGYAQRLSVSLQHNVVVAFDATNRNIRVHEDQNNNNVIDAGERVTSVPVEDGVVFGKGTAPSLTYTTGVAGAATFNFTKTQGGLPCIIFRRDGSASENGGFYINTNKGVAAGTNNWVRAAEVIRSSGRIIWYSYATSSWVQGN